MSVCLSKKNLNLLTLEPIGKFKIHRRKMKNKNKDVDLFCENKNYTDCFKSLK